MAASVILAKCSASNKTYGIRVEMRGSDWVSTWAFPIDDGKAKREGFDRTKIKGTFQPVDGYPGCPYCNAQTLAQCPCGKMICYDISRSSGSSEKKSEEKSERKSELKQQNTAGNMIQCPWCGIKIKEIKEVESFEVKSGKV